jgi:hypothetical protein
MRKLLFLFCIALSLQACSLLDLIPRPAPASTFTVTSSPTASNTATLTLVPTRTTTPTPRDTATLIVSEFDTPVILVSEAAATLVFNPDPGIFIPGTLSAPVGGFESIELSQGKIFYGVCKQNYTKMTVKVTDPQQVRRVYLFYRLESGKKPGDTTRWYGTVTYNDGGGYFLYTMWANNIPERKNFLNAWVQYQFVAEDSAGEIVGRTQVYTRNLVLEPCK